MDEPESVQTVLERLDVPLRTLSDARAPSAAPQARWYVWRPPLVRARGLGRRQNWLPAWEAGEPGGRGSF